MIKLSPSILAADFARLGDELKMLENLNVPYVHIDVMDGHFVPNISMGIPVIRSIRKVTNMTLDVHLMISNPDMYIDDFADAGADIINVHKEVCSDVVNVIEHIKRKGKKAGITLNPKTPPEAIFGILDMVDMVLIMSVEPGFGGQKFIPSSLDKAYKLYNYIQRKNLNVDIEMDGGVNIHNIRDVIESGVNVVVVGSAIFNAKDKQEEIRKYQKIFENFKLEQ